MKTRKKTNRASYYIIKVFDGVEVEKLYGPYSTKVARDKAVKGISDNDGDLLLQLDISTNGKPKVGSWSGAELDVLRGWKEI